MVVLWSGVAFVMGCRGGAGSVEQQILRFAKDDKKWVSDSRRMTKRPKTGLTALAGSSLETWYSSGLRA